MFSQLPCFGVRPSQRREPSDHAANDRFRVRFPARHLARGGVSRFFRSQQRPTTLHRVDVNFVMTIAVLVEHPIAPPANVALTIRLGFVVATAGTPAKQHFGDLRHMAVWAFDLFRPTKLPHHPVTFRVVDQFLNIQSHPS